MHAGILAGASWMQAPQRVSDRYSAGFAIGGSLTIEPIDRVRFTAEADYLDLPSSGGGYYGAYSVNGIDTLVSAIGPQKGLGMGHAIPLLGIVSARIWRGAWLEGGAGAGYFDSGFPDIQFIDGATNTYVDIPGNSGWGPAVTLGLKYEFFLHNTDHLYASFHWVRLARGSEELEFVPIRLGYRFD